jgi:hypothetical protein
MKKAILLAVALLIGVNCMAQEQLAFPFQGGKDIMARFFRDSLTVSPLIKQKKASGTVVIKFSADDQGTIKKLIIYYADDLMLTQPVIEALKKSNHKWIIPDREKFHDFIIHFTIGFTPPAVSGPSLQRAVYDYYSHRKPVLSYDQVPLDMATLLPTVVVNYTLGQ